MKPTAKAVFEQILTHSLSEGFLKNYLPVILQTIAAWSQESFESFLHSLCMHNMKYIQMFSFLLPGITFWQMLLFLNASNNEDFMLLYIEYVSNIFAIRRFLIVCNLRFSCYKLRKYLILVLNMENMLFSPVFRSFSGQMKIFHWLYLLFIKPWFFKGLLKSHFFFFKAVRRCCPCFGSDRVNFHHRLFILFFFWENSSCFSWSVMSKTLKKDYQNRIRMKFFLPNDIYKDSQDNSGYRGCSRCLQSSAHSRVSCEVRLGGSGLLPGSSRISLRMESALSFFLFSHPLLSPCSPVQLFHGNTMESNQVGWSGTNSFWEIHADCS